MYKGLAIDNASNLLFAADFVNNQVLLIQKSAVEVLQNTFKS